MSASSLVLMVAAAAQAAVAQPGGAAVHEGPLAAYVRAVASADIPAAAEVAYRRGLRLDPANIQLHAAWVRRMVTRQEARQAYAAAGVLAARGAADGQAWAVIAHMRLDSGHPAGALPAVIAAMKLDPQDPFVRQTARAYAAWHDAQPAAPEPSAETAEALGKIRTELFGAASSAPTTQPAGGEGKKTALPAPVVPPLPPGPILPAAGPRPADRAPVIAAGPEPAWPDRRGYGPPAYLSIYSGLLYPDYGYFGWPLLYPYGGYCGRYVRDTDWAAGHFGVHIRGTFDCGRGWFNVEFDSGNWGTGELFRDFRPVGAPPERPSAPYSPPRFQPWSGPIGRSVGLPGGPYVIRPGAGGTVAGGRR